MNKILNGLAGLLVILVLLAGCRAARPVVKAPLKEEGPDFLYTKLKEHELKFDWLSLKFDASYKEKRNTTDFKGQIRIRKDSLIWLTITPAMGIEMIRMVITTDSVKYVNRFKKEYFTGDYKLVSSFLQINVDFDMLQSILLGNDFQFYENNSFRASIDNLEYKLSTTDRRKIRKVAEASSDDAVVLLQNIWLDSDSFKIKKIDLKEYEKDNRKLEAMYGGFTAFDNQIYPATVNYNIIADNTLKVHISYNKVIMNEPMAFPFSIPDNYEKIK